MNVCSSCNKCLQKIYCILPCSHRLVQSTLAFHILEVRISSLVKRYLNGFDFTNGYCLPQLSSWSKSEKPFNRIHHNAVAGIMSAWKFDHVGMVCIKWGFW